MTEEDNKWSMDWRVALGLILTTVWITTGVIYLRGVVGMDRFVHLPTADIGSFLEGAFAPLAFLWLVIGHFMQQKEITANTKAIKIQEAAARRQEVHAQRESYFKLLSLVQDQLGSIAGFHYMSVCGPSGSGEVTQHEFSEQRAAATGDSGWFIRKMITLVASNQENTELVQDMLFGTEIRTRHSNNFTQTFSKLLSAAQAVDTDDMLTNALLWGSAAGIYYRIIRHVSGEEPMDPVTGISGGPAMAVDAH